MERNNKIYANYVQILKEELVPAMGCTEPIALAYGVAKAKDVLGMVPDRILVEVSGNIVKNVKSVVVPNTGGLKGIEAAAAAGAVAGKADKVLEVISEVTEPEKEEIKKYLKKDVIEVRPMDSEIIFDIRVTLYGGGHEVSLRISYYHTNIVHLERDGKVLYNSDGVESQEESMADKKLLNVKDILEFARTVELEDVEKIISRQIDYNTAIAEEGLKSPYGANIGKVILHTYGDDVRTRAKAVAAAGSDARMSGCELPVIINSGSGNQGMATSLPVIVYAKEINSSKEELYRALVLANLLTIRQKTGIGSLSAYCGAVCAGCASAAGIAYLLGGGYEEIAHTLVNSLAIVSGIVCDGAKPSCAAKIAASVDAGILGYNMYKQGQQFLCGEGLVESTVEKTIDNIGRLGKEGMKETDKEIIRMMIG